MPLNRLQQNVLLCAIKAQKNGTRTSVSVKCTSASSRSIGRSYSPSHHTSCCPCLFAFSDAEVTSHGPGQTHKLWVSATCKSYDIVHVIQCKRCGQQYVGETEQALHEHLNSHRFDIRCGKISEKPVAANFCSNGHSVI